MVPRFICGYNGSEHFKPYTDMPVKESMTNYVIIIVIGLLLLNVWMHFQQPHMIFYPVRELYQTPADWGLDYEDVTFNTADNVQLHGWYIPQQPSEQVLLFFHGNAGNISHRRDSIELFHRLGLSVFIIDYRGYGKSKGKPDEQGLYRSLCSDPTVIKFRQRTRSPTPGARLEA